MLKLLLSLSLLLWSFQAFAKTGIEPTLLFAEANKMYAAGKYSEAIPKYELILEKGFKTAPVYANLGNAFHLAGNKGKAIFYLQKARYLDPLDQEILQNLQIVTGQPKQLENAGLTDLFSTDKMNKLVAEFGLSGASALVLISSLLFLISVIRNESKKIALLRKIAFGLGITGALVVLLCLVHIWYLRPSEKSMVVFKDTAGFVGPSENANENAKLIEGELVKMAGYYQGWYKVKTDKGAETWLTESMVGKIAD